MFSVCAVVVFSYFILTDRTFISNDGWRQHFVSFVYFGEYVRDIIKNLILNHKLEIPAYSFGIGMGGDILTTLNYYVIGDPLSLLSVVTPQKYARFAYDFLVNTGYCKSAKDTIEITFSTAGKYHVFCPGA